MPESERLELRGEACAQAGRAVVGQLRVLERLQRAPHAPAEARVQVIGRRRGGREHAVQRVGAVSVQFEQVVAHVVHGVLVPLPRVARRLQRVHVDAVLEVGRQRRRGVASPRARPLEGRVVQTERV